MQSFHAKSSVVALAALVFLGVALSVQAAKFQAGHTEITFDADGVMTARGAGLSGVLVPFVVQYDRDNPPIAPDWRPGDPIIEIPRRHWGDPAVLVPDPVPVNPTAPGIDPLALMQRDYDALIGRGGGVLEEIVSIQALAFSGVNPPDTVGDIGTTHYIQAINGSGGTRYNIYEKDGTLAVGPLVMQNLAPVGTLCRNGLGDPIVLFDRLANRWMLSEFSNNGNAVCIYISQTEDPTDGSWFNYQFVAPSFPDYPKYGVWNDAYYLGTNEGGANAPTYVLERAKMLLGEPAAFQRIAAIPKMAGFGFQMVTPADVEGTVAPPAGTPGMFMRHRDDEAHNPGSNDPNQDFLEIYTFSVDWDTPANSSVTGPQSIAISEINSRLNGLTAFSAIPQPNSGTQLDPLREPVMHRLIYRNFGTYEALVGNLVTNVGINDTTAGRLAGVRWFELRREGGPSEPWTLHQEGTYAPDTTHRWMAGISMDDSGNMLLGYSVSNATVGSFVFPGLRVVGREAGDPLGVMTTQELVLRAGVSHNGSNRYGDYHAMGVDPEDGCTFWFTGQYSPATQWSTWAGAYRFQTCGEPGFAMSGTNLNQSICALPAGTGIDPVTITLTSVQDYDEPVTLSLADPLPTGFSNEDFSVNPVIPTDTSVFTVDVDDSATPGLTNLTLQGVGAGVVEGGGPPDIVRELSLNLNVFTETSPAPGLLSPANGALGQPLTVTLSWSGVAQAQTYRVEVATDAGFTDVVVDQSVAGTSHTVAGGVLVTSTNYFWRVTPDNACGAGDISVVFGFRTVAAPGDCDEGQNTVVNFSEDFNAGAGGFVTTGSSGAQTWALSTLRPSPISGGNAFRATNIATVSDQRLTSPTISLPTADLPITLLYQNWRLIEQRTATTCWDGGILEISVDNGAFTQIGGAQILNDPYRGEVWSGFDNPLTGLDAWCNDPAREYADTLVDLSAWAGSDIQLRWRLGTDSSVAREGWYVDDIRVQSCQAPGADLSVDKQVDVSGPGPGDTVVFTITAANAGPLDATGVVVIDLLPDGYLLLDTTVSSGAYDAESGTWTIGDLDQGADAVLTLSASVRGQGDYLNTATIGGDQGDPFPHNNSASATPDPVIPAAVFADGFE